jgi:glycosyltransferase involved in cell wall biosynthesis
MKIGFQSAVIDDNRTGLGTYARNLLKSFENLNKINQVCLIHYPGKKNDFYKGKCESIVPEYPLSLSKVFGIPVAVKKCNPDLVHFPVHRCDDFLTYFLNSDVKKILTIHDLIPFFYNEQKDLQTRYLWVQMLKIAHKKNTCIIADSNQTKRDCEKYLHVSREKIRVIPLAADPVFRQHEDIDAVRSRISARFGIELPFLFYTGSLLPRKNIRRLIEAFHILKRKDYPHTLVIGGSETSCPKDLREIITNENMQREVLFTGYVTKEDLVDLYNAAEIFVYPSLYEGFGIPPLEAMACGTPVIVSNTSSLPEVVGDAGKLIDPYNTQELAAVLEELILDEGYRTELAKKGMRQAGLFSWEMTGRETWKVYEEQLK